MNYPKHYFYRRIVQAKLFIDAHYAENIELFAIADEAYYSKFHFIRQFKKTYRRTPHQYLISVRINAAMKLLANGTPVAITAQAVGFLELSSFSRLFKKRVGVNPSVYLILQNNLRQQVAKAPITVVPHCFAYQYGWLKRAISDK